MRKRVWERTVGDRPKAVSRPPTSQPVQLRSIRPALRILAAPLLSRQIRPPLDSAAPLLNRRLPLLRAHPPPPKGARLPPRAPRRSRPRRKLKFRSDPILARLLLRNRLQLLNPRRPLLRVRKFFLESLWSDAAAHRASLIGRDAR